MLSDWLSGGPNDAVYVYRDLDVIHKKIDLVLLQINTDIFLFFIKDGQMTMDEHVVYLTVRPVICNAVIEHLTCAHHFKCLALVVLH